MVYQFYLFLVQYIDCGYSLEHPLRGGEAVLTCTHDLCLKQKYKKNLKNFLMKFSIFTAEKDLCTCILHGQVFVMAENFEFTI